jgi:hypothetical protein
MIAYLILEDAGRVALSLDVIIIYEAPFERNAQSTVLN